LVAGGKGPSVRANEGREKKIEKGGEREKEWGPPSCEIAPKQRE